MFRKARAAPYICVNILQNSTKTTRASNYANVVCECVCVNAETELAPMNAEHRTQIKIKDAEFDKMMLSKKVQQQQQIINLYVRSQDL